MELFRKVVLAGFAALSVLTLWLVLACCPDAALAASPDGAQPSPGQSEPNTGLDALNDRFNKHAILYEEDPSDPTGRQLPVQ